MASSPKIVLLDRLLGERRITTAQREHVVAHVEATHCRVEDALIETGTVEEGFLLKWLAASYRTRFVSTEKLERAEVERSVLALIPQRLAERYLVFPVLFDSSDKSLAVVMPDPDDVELVRQLQLAANVSQVKAYVARPMAIRAAIRKHYAGDIHAFRKVDAAGYNAIANQVDYQRGVSATETFGPPPFGGQGSDAQRSTHDTGLAGRPRTGPFEPQLDTGLFAAPSFDSLHQSGALPTGGARSGNTGLLQPPAIARLGGATDTSGGTSELEIVNVLVSLLENHRQELRGHSAQVARLMQKVARHLHLPEAEVQAFRLCGLLHDVGKTANYHLTALNVAEYEGHRTEAKKCFLTPVRLFDTGALPRSTVEGISSLYERFDGEGFPERRSGKEISLAARLLAIAESFTDLTENARNPFRKIVGAKAALQVLGRYRDRVFDGQLLDAFRAAALGEEGTTGFMLQKQRILLLDADSEETTVLELRLVEHGYDVFLCRTVEQALRRIQAGGVDVLITEVDLLPHDGLSFVEHLRSQRAHSDLTVFFLTRRADRASVERGLALSAVDYIIKPAAPEIVVAKTKNALAKVGRQRGGRGVSGSLSEMPLPDVLQVLTRTRKTGLLRVIAEGRAGDIQFGNGAIYNASFGTERGAEAVYALLHLTHGQFELDSSFVPSSRELHASTEELLLEGMRRVDERPTMAPAPDFSVTRSDDG